jgi:hypothetical protein
MEYEFSCQATERLTQAIVNQNDGYEEDLEALNKIKSGISKKRNEWFTAQRNVIVNEMEESQRLQLDLAAEKGASSWLTALPVKEFGYLMNKQEFNDALALRYNLNLKDSPRKCVCGENNTVNHLLICKKGGYVSLRHNSLRDLFKELMTNASCKDVYTEPILLNTDGVKLSPGTITTDDARVDISARSVWNPLERALFDVRVFHAPAPSNRNLKTIPAMYRHHENEKKRKYGDRIIQIERATFTPLVFSTTGGMGLEAQALVRRLAEKLSRVKNQKYPETVSFIRRRLRFDMLKTTIIALRGYRGKQTQAPDIETLDFNLDPSVG